MSGEGLGIVINVATPAEWQPESLLTYGGTLDQGTPAPSLQTPHIPSPATTTHLPVIATSAQCFTTSTLSAHLLSLKKKGAFFGGLGEKWFSFGVTVFVCPLPPTLRNPSNLSFFSRVGMKKWTTAAARDPGAPHLSPRP